jgi:hypothetical protein
MRQSQVMNCTHQNHRNQAAFLLCIGHQRAQYLGVGEEVL